MQCYDRNEMTVARQEDSLKSGRTNQRARTRRALIDAAHALMGEGRAPSMPDAAERALVSVATAYRYFRSAEELWDDAAAYGTSGLVDWDDVRAAIEACGDDAEARVDAVTRGIGWVLVDNALLARRSAKASLDRWFAQQGTDDADRSVRPGERVRWIALALQPLRTTLEDHQVDSIAEALAFVVGAEAVVTALDVLHLSPEAAKERMLVTTRWILRAGLAEAQAHGTLPTRPAKKR
jgi:AcrR family transcriptional regulator